MLPPNPHSRQSSYVYHPSPRRQISYAGSRVGGADDQEEGREEADALDMEVGEEMLEDERGLEETLEKLGFGAYHWRLLALCGFGWMSDNSALQCIAVILPRVQVHFNLSSQVVGLLSASTMAGMMVGAVAWGTASDVLGRALPFNSTLFLTAVFGIGASFAPNFSVLCVWMFLLGSAVGGSMPTDGTLFLENLPHSKQYLLTLLSVFFSMGAVLSSVISLIFLPSASCSEFQGCDIEGKANDGWRRVLFVLGLINLVCSLARLVLFRLHESPRFLVSTGREAEAVVVLRAIATFNDQEMDIQCADVAEKSNKTSNLPSPCEIPISASGSRSPTPRPPSVNEETVEPRSGSRGRMEDLLLPDQENSSRLGSGSRTNTNYDSVGIGLPVSDPPRQPIRAGSAFYTADTDVVVEERNNNAFEQSFGAAALRDEEESYGLINGDAKRGMVGTDDCGKKSSPKAVPVVGSWVDQIAKLFVPQWRRTVILMWIIWGAMAFAYTMFNVWLPAVLESRASGTGAEAIKQSLNEFVLYSMAGCPGSVIGAWMIQTRLGRRKSLAICTLATSIATFAFIKVRQDWAVVVSSMIISMAATAMYAVLYGMTPETFGTAIRGTACGTSAALSRFTGILAPVSAGLLLAISPSLPLLMSAVIFVATAACSLALPFERVADRGPGVGGMMH